MVFFMNINRQRKLHQSKMPSFQWLVGILFVIFCTIPWVHFGLNRMDSQPWPIIFSLFFLLISSTHFGRDKFIFILLWLVLFGILLGLFFRDPDIDFLLLRGIANYVGFTILFLAFISFLRKYGFPLTTLVTMNMAWLLAGILEVISPGILNAVVLERTTLDRGLTSLAPEPTFFAVYLFFNSWLILIGTFYQPTKKIKMLILINILAILGLAMSAMVTLFLVISVVFAATFMFIRSSIKKSVFIYGGVAIVLLVLIFSLTINFFEGSRLVKLIYKAIHTPWIEIFKYDASINSRLAHAVLPVHGFFYNYGIPGGFNSFDTVSQELVKSYNGYFWYGIGGNKIMSWVGSFLYELGFFGLISLGFLATRLLDGTRKRKFEISLLFILLFSATPLAFPLAPLIIATLYFTRINSHCYSTSKQKGQVYILDKQLN